MSLEIAISNLTVAVQENTAALKAAGSGQPAASTPAPAPTSTKKPAAPAAPKSTHTKEEVNAVLTEVKEKKSTQAAKTIIKDVGGVDKMADIPADKFDVVYDAAKKALGEEEGGGDI